MLFFGSRCDRLCMVQYSLISLIPGLLRNLQDCAEPELNNYEKKLSRSTSLQSSNRSSLLSFMGLPLQIFGKVRPLEYRLQKAKLTGHYREASSAHTLPSSNSTSSPTLAPSHTLSAVQTHFSFNRKTDTAIS